MSSRRYAVLVASLVPLTLGGVATAEPQASSQAALDRVDGLFDGYYAWFGSMYDRHSGGAYYSPLARANPEAYPPHIESTSKFTRVIEWSGLLAQTPDAVKHAIVNDYFKPKQVADPNHAYAGFFLDGSYANLDPANNGARVSDTAAARALGFSVDAIGLFGGTPDHPLPDVNQGGLSHLQSGAAFTRWLEERNWDRTWTAGGDILAQAETIKRLDPAKQSEVLDAAWTYLEGTQQDPSTGNWGNTDQGDNRNPYILLNGAHKISSFYTEFGRVVPHADALLDDSLDEIATHNATNLLFVYNASQLVSNLTAASGATISEEELSEFVESEARYLSQFRQPDGGFSSTLGGAGGNVYAPASDGPVSNTDVGGLALRTRDTLHDLVNGSHQPLAAASDPRLFGMSGVNSEAIVSYSFADKSLAANTAGDVTASDFAAVGTNATPGDNGFFTSADDFAIGHSGFGDANSYYHFSLEPDAEPRSLYFLALTARNGSDGSDEKVLVEFALGDDPTEADFVEAGWTTIPGASEGFVVRDIPLLTLAALQDVDQRVSFRIYGSTFANDGRTFRLDDVSLFAAPIPEPAAAAMSGGLLSMLLARRPDRS